MRHNEAIATQLHLRVHQVAAAVGLLDDGNTLPFIARYRKEATGGLDEEQLRSLSELLLKLRALDDRRGTVLKSIAEQGKLTPELEAQVMAADSMTALEDLYQPYKPKRRTRASVAKEKGLAPLADLIIQQRISDQTLEELAQPYITSDVPDVASAWSGARDIVAEMISDHPQVRGSVRQKALQWGLMRCKKTEAAEDPQGKYQLYYDFEQRLDRLRPHQVLAINRGEADRVLRVRIDLSERDWQAAILDVFPVNNGSSVTEQLQEATIDAAHRLLLPAIERDVRRTLSEQTEDHAIRVFSENLRALLTQPPLSGNYVLGIDPGYRTGCKVAVVDPTGKVLETTTIYPHEPQKQWDSSIQILSTMVNRHRVNLVAIGNGTASRETESLVAQLTQQRSDVRYLIVNEAGASVYSASPLARRELPDLDVSLRGAVSIARRVQDALAELVKIDPRSIGVGMYQHDVDQKKLSNALHGVVESTVNRVGVDLNTASPALLAYVAGIGSKLAERLIVYRDAHGPFSSRDALHSVPGIGPKSYQQAAGFLRVHTGNNRLDASAIHPESYPAAIAVLAKAGTSMDAPPADRKAALDALQARQPVQELAAELGVGLPTLEDIFEQLVRPGRDPRRDLPAPILRSDVLKLGDLSVGMCLKGTVRNVVDFGVFVDIGVKQDGLLHRSQLPPGIELKVGYVVEVQVLNVEIDRGRISLGWPRRN